MGQLTRRRALFAAAALTGTKRAAAFSERRSTAEVADDYAARCGSDSVHAGTLEVAIARLKAEHVAFDEARLRATLVCPICGCSILSLNGR
jgi:hypothetical protein